MSPSDHGSIGSIQWPGGEGMKVLELFAGSRSIGKAAERQGCRVLSLDVEAFDGVQIVRSILDFNLDELASPPHFIWASVVCTSYSMLAIRHHRRGTLAISETARLGDQLTQKTLQIIREAEVLFMIENPRAMLRKMPYMKGLDRRTVCYCKYGDSRMKPTDLWSNMFYSMVNPEGYQVRSMCYNNNKHCHHEASPRFSTLKARGARRTGGTVMMKDSYERSKLPDQLCDEIIATALHQHNRINVI